MEKENTMVIYDSMVSTASEEDVIKINNRIGKMCKGALKNIWGNVLTLVEMANSNKVSWGIKAVAIGALLYTVSPADAIPDIIPLIGLTDDAAVIGIALTTLGKAISKYKSVR